MHFKTKLTLAGLALVAATAFPLRADDDYNQDFGVQTEQRLHSQSQQQFGFGQPLSRPADATDYVPRQSAAAWQRVRLAKGLKAEFVTRNIATNGDMIALWPTATSPTHLIVCIEADLAAGGTNAGVQRVHIATGVVQTILYGTKGCDGIRTTPWGTILATEEEDDGHAYEILDPLTTTGHWVENRATGLIRTSIGGAVTSTKIATRFALPTMAWEGLAVLPSGVVIAGDELRPGTGVNGNDGGAIFKFLPDVPNLGGAVNALNQSPLVSGKVYAMVTSCQPKSSSSFPQFGQGCEIGVGAWVRVGATTARADANSRGATGYYRPEDLHQDKMYTGPGVRFCFANTGNEGANNYAEVICGVDDNPLPTVPNEWLSSGKAFLTATGTARADATTVVVNRFVEGDLRFNSFDNLDFQPKTGNLYVIEDHTYGEVIACLPDGADRDLKTDGCVGVLSVVDPLAEPTGFIFDASGQTAYVILQHGEQPGGMVGTDDILKITGFKTSKKNYWDD